MEAQVGDFNERKAKTSLIKKEKGLQKKIS